MTIHVTPIPKLTVFATPAFAFATTAAAGDSETPVRSNSTIDISALQASKAQMEAATATGVFPTPSVVQDHPGVAKAWLQMAYSGGTPTIVGSYNISSLTDSGTGLFKSVWNTDFSGTTYSVVGICRTDNDSSDVFSASSAATTDINVSLRRGGTKTDLPAMLAAFGDQ
jgi:hypothetical protein